MLIRLGAKVRSYLALVALISIALVAQPAGSAQAAVDGMTINMGLYGGTPTYRASGFIYGLSQNGATPASTLQTQIKAKVLRAGGSQIGCPNGGYVNGAYSARWNFERAYYARGRQSGAYVEMILAGLWGADGVCNVPRWPGDNGNWTEYTNFINQVIADVRAAGMTGSDVRYSNPFTGGVLLFTTAGFQQDRNVRYSDSTADAGFALDMGGGFDIRLGKGLGFRVAMDYDPTFLTRPAAPDLTPDAQGRVSLSQLTSNGRRQDHVRLSVGIVWHIR